MRKKYNLSFKLNEVISKEGGKIKIHSKNIDHINQAKETPALTPIIDTVYEILYRKKNAKNAFKKLTEMLS